MPETTISLAKKSIQTQYIKATIYRRQNDLTWETTGIDVSRNLLSEKISRIEKSVDPSNFDVGLFFSSKIKIFIDNKRGKYSDVDNSRSIWSGLQSRDNSILKFESGYVDENGNEIPNTAFEGMINDKTFKEDVDDTINFEVFGFEQLFKETKIIPGSLANNNVKNVIYYMVNRPEITGIMNVSLSNINPDNDIYINNPGTFNNESIKDSLARLLLASNSVAYIDNNRNFIVKDRGATTEVIMQFYLNSQGGNPDNIYKISRESGKSRVFNVFVSDDRLNYKESGSDNLRLYGANIKKIKMEYTTNSTIKDSILARLLREFQFPKEEIELETDYLGDAINLLNKCTIEVYPNVIDTGYDAPRVGEAIIGTAVLTDYDGGFIVYGNKAYKVIKIKHDLKNTKTSLRLRNTGVSLDDGYLGSSGQPGAVGFAIVGESITG